MFFRRAFNWYYPFLVLRGKTFQQKRPPSDSSSPLKLITKPDAINQYFFQKGHCKVYGAQRVSHTHHIMEKQKGQTEKDWTSEK